jgi:hypothetical protein
MAKLNSLSQKEVKKSPRFVEKNDGINISRVIFPHNMQVGLADSEFQSNLIVKGEIQGHVHQTAGGISYLVAGTGITIASGSNGQVTITSSITGDITSVVAGVGLSGGGTEGDVTLTLDISELSSVTPTSGDAFATLDNDGSTEQKTTADNLATLFAGDGLTATSAVIALDVNELTEAVIASGDYIAFSDEGESGDPTRRESIDDIATLFAGAGLAASSAVMGVGAGTGITVNANDIQTNDSAIVHDNLSGFVANEHIDHSGVSISAGAGLTGGGDITSSRTITVGAGTGIDVAADAISVDVSDFMTNGVDDRIVTATGTDAMNAEANLNFDGSKLKVTGSLATTGDITVAGNITVSGGNIYGPTDNTLYLISDGNINVKLDNDNDATKYFLIGNHSAYKYAISEAGKINQGDSSVPKNSYTLRHTNADGDNGLLIVNNNTTVADDDWLGGIGFDSNDGNVPSSILEASAFIGAYAAEAHGSSDKGGYLVLGTSAVNENDDTASTEHMRIDSDGLITLAGNIKIGGNIIQASDGGSTITMDTSDNVTVAGDLGAQNLTIVNDILTNSITGSVGITVGASMGNAFSVTGTSDTYGSNGIARIYNSDASLATGNVTLRIQHNDASTGGSQYWIAFYEDDSLRGGIDSEVAYDTFTGCHPTSIDATKITSIIKGMILKSTGDVFYRQENSISNAWVTTEATMIEKDKAVVGVYNKPSAWDGVVNESPNGKQLYMYNAVGEGQVLVTDEGGSIENGDYICSSNRKGHGMKQDDDIMHNYTVAKATEGIDFSNTSVDDNLGYKSKLIACTYHCG